LKTALIIDTSTDHTIVGLVSNSKLLIVHSHNDAIAHGEVLPKLVQQLITEHRDVNLEQVVVGMGPGLFTGLRAGIAFAKMFALAKNLDCVGVCSLDAAALPAGKYVIANDAKRREYFYATYENGARISELQVGPLNLIKDLGLEVKLDQLPDVMMMYKAAQANQLTTQPIYLRKPDAYPAPKGVTFRAMNQLDLVNVSALEKICYPKDAWSIAQFKSELAGVPKTHHYLVAEVDNQIVGYAGIFGIDEVADVHTLSVDPKFRRRGIGRELLRRLIDWSRTRKMKAMMLEVRIANDEAIVLYKEQGFSVISQRENYYGPGQTAYVMRKELQ
jgi:ribosomal-protein-alanine acetyltransferase/tRNA threonylcarbamoyl adenosine modification protein YeaZ